MQAGWQAVAVQRATTHTTGLSEKAEHCARRRAFIGTSIERGQGSESSQARNKNSQMVQEGWVAGPESTGTCMASTSQCRCRRGCGCGCGGGEAKPSMASSAATSSRLRMRDRPAMLCCLRRALVARQGPCGGGRWLVQAFGAAQEALCTGRDGGRGHAQASASCCNHHDSANNQPQPSPKPGSLRHGPQLGKRLGAQAKPHVKVPQRLLLLPELALLNLLQLHVAGAGQVRQLMRAAARTRKRGAPFARQKFT